MVGVAVVGAGYWGPNLVRNVALNPGTELRWVCDLDLARATGLSSTYAGAEATSSLDQVLGDDRVDAVVIATPASSHCDIAIAALRAGKHVLIEKPLATSVRDAEKMVTVAREERRVLMCDHTYCYTPAVQHIHQLVSDGVLGDIQFIDSVRINLGLVQHDVDVIWDLAPHDLSVFDHILPERNRVESVAARGADPIGAGQACVGYLTLGLGGNAIGHIHVNWLSPTKVRTMIIGGSERTLVWDDLDPAQRISVYDQGVDLDLGDDHAVRHRTQVSYRVGDMVAPALGNAEALGGVISELVAAIHEEREPLTGAGSGVRVLQILEAASTSLHLDGASVSVADVVPESPAGLETLTEANR